MAAAGIDLDGVLDALAAALAARMPQPPAAPAAPEGYLAVEAAAEYLDAPASRVYDLAAAGKLRVVRDGRRVLTRASWIDEYLAGCDGER